MRSRAVPVGAADPARPGGRGARRQRAELAAATAEADARYAEMRRSLQALRASAELDAGPGPGPGVNGPARAATAALADAAAGGRGDTAAGAGGGEGGEGGAGGGGGFADLTVD